MQFTDMYCWSSGLVHKPWLAQKGQCVVLRSPQLMPGRSVGQAASGVYGTRPGAGG